MATDLRYPGASSRVSRGKVTWRYRQPGANGEQTTLPGLPGEEEFDAVYHAVSRVKSAAEIFDLPGRALPRTFGKAALMVENQPWWARWDKATHDKDLKFIERFLESRVSPDASLTWRKVPVEAMTREALNGFLMAIYSEKPQTGRHMYNAIKKLYRVALEAEWIKPENNPCLSIILPKPNHVGEHPWSLDAMAQYEAHHPYGTRARTAYEIIRWMGNRADDVANLNWDDRKTKEEEDDDGNFIFLDCFEFRQRKNRTKNGGKHMVSAVTGKFAIALSALTPEPGKTVLQNETGQPYSVKALSKRMQYWTKQAGLPPGHTMHGLRKSFAQMLLKSKVDILAIMHAMGHSSLAVTQVYLEGIRKEESAVSIFRLVEERESKRDEAKRDAIKRALAARAAPQFRSIQGGKA